MIELKKKTYDRIAESDLFKWTHQATNALCYLHSKDITHRDVRPVNIFLSDTTRNCIKLDRHQIGRHGIKLAGFDISKQINKSKSLKDSKRVPFLSPELFEGNDPSFKSDIWSILDSVNFKFRNITDYFLLFFFFLSYRSLGCSIYELFSLQPYDRANEEEKLNSLGQTRLELIIKKCCIHFCFCFFVDNFKYHKNSWIVSSGTLKENPNIYHE